MYNYILYYVCWQNIDLTYQLHTGTYLGSGVFILIICCLSTINYIVAVHSTRFGTNP